MNINILLYQIYFIIIHKSNIPYGGVILEFIVYKDVRTSLPGGFKFILALFYEYFYAI